MGNELSIFIQWITKYDTSINVLKSKTKKQETHKKNSAENNSGKTRIGKLNKKDINQCTR